MDLTQYGRLFGIQAVLVALLVLLLAGVVIAAVAARTEAGTARRRGVRRTVVASVAVFGACLTWLVALTPAAFAGMERAIEWNPVYFAHAGDSIAISHLVGNLLMVTWVGLCAPVLWHKLTWLGTVGVVAAVSLSIEAIQFATALGRVASTQDLMMNVIGGALAAVVGVVYIRPWVEGDRV